MYSYIVQGILGDCWLLSTCAALAKREDLIYKVVNPDQVGRWGVLVENRSGRKRMVRKW